MNRASTSPPFLNLTFAAHVARSNSAKHSDYESASQASQRKRKVVSPDINGTVIWCTFIICADKTKQKTASVANCFRFSLLFLYWMRMYLLKAHPRSAISNLNHSALVRCFYQNRQKRKPKQHIHAVHRSVYGRNEHEINKKYNNNNRNKKIRRLVQWLLASNRNTI